MYKTALKAGFLFGALAVMLGAFAAHGLKEILPPDKIEVFQKGVTYQFYHSFAMLAIGIIYGQMPSKHFKTALYLFIAGLICFSGTLYLFPFMETKNIAIPVAARLITPLGGLCFIGGWLAALWAVIRS